VFNGVDEKKNDDSLLAICWVCLLWPLVRMKEKF